MRAPVPAVAVRAGVDGTVRVAGRRLAGRPAVVARSASDRRRGALARRDGESIEAGAHLALQQRVPLVLELSSSGADVAEGVDALHGWGRAARAVADCSGTVPVVAVVTGPVISGPAFLLGLSDVVIMTADAVAFVSGPSMVAAFTGVRVSMAELGGVGPHGVASGLCSLATDEPEVAVEEVLGYLPPHADALAEPLVSDDPVDRQTPELRQLVPERGAASYDVRRVIETVADDGVALELGARWAPQLVTALARLGGRPVGVVANQPMQLAGTLDIAASQKGARFVALLDAFNLPIVSLVDTPGFLPGKDLEWRGMIRHGAELVFAYAQASVPRIGVVMRKAFGGAYIVMDSKGLGNDICLAWPGAEVAVMGAPGAARILHRRADPDQRAAAEAEYRHRHLNPWEAAARGLVDDVIDPSETRAALCRNLALLASKRESVVGRKHANGPL